MQLGQGLFIFIQEICIQTKKMTIFHVDRFFKKTMKKLLTGLLVIYLIVLLSGLSFHGHPNNYDDSHCPVCLFIRSIQASAIIQYSIVFVLAVLFITHFTLLLFLTSGSVRISSARAPPDLIQF